MTEIQQFEGFELIAAADNNLFERAREETRQTTEEPIAAGLRELVIACPSTGALVQTRVFIGILQFEDPDVRWSTYAARCPRCEEVHTWSKADAQLHEEELFAAA